MARRTAGIAPALSRLGLALVVSVLAGLLMAGLAFPLVGGIGVSVRDRTDEFLALPTELETPSLPVRSRILAADGSLLATLFLENRQTATLLEVPVMARKALLAIEDSRFYAHNGVDYKGTLRAAAKNSSAGGVQQGGSTLTQQYVKNVLLEQAATKDQQEAAREATLERKLKEARYAIALEKRLTKDQILEAYLNIAYYGNGVYGIKTAASHYFSKPVGKLTLAEGALLAGMVQNPNRLDPSDAEQRPAVLERRGVVLQRMVDLAYITEAERARAAREPLRLKINKLVSGCEAPDVTAPFFCDYVRRQLLEDTELGKLLGQDQAERTRRLFGGGLTIRTTLDPVVQRAAKRAVDGRVPPKDPSRVAAVADVVEPATGDIKAMAVNRTFGEAKGRADQTKVNLALGGSSGFQAGSTMKVFVLARAIQMGIPLNTRINSPANYCPKAFDYELADGSCPGNAGDSESGVFDLVTGTHDSVNTFYIQLAERTGLVTPPALAQALGVRQLGPRGPDLGNFASFVLGTNEVSPLDMAAAYATFANRGVHCTPRAITAITEASGKPLPVPEGECRRVMDQADADKVTSVLRGVIDGSTPGRTGKSASIGRPAAGKTGTTNGSLAAWFIGYTPQLSTAVWVGKPVPKPLRNITIDGRGYRQVYGGSLPAPIWRDLMASALAGQPALDFEDAPLAALRAPARRPERRPREAAVPPPATAPVSTGTTRPLPTPEPSSPAPQPSRSPRPKPTK